jgi:hypothetical protein
MAFVSTPWSITAYRLHPADDADASDPASATWTMAQCRARVRRGDVRGGMLALLGIGNQVRTQPAVKAQATQLLGQLVRLPQAREQVDLHRVLVNNEGWIAGDLFVDRYITQAAQRKEAMCALVLTGTTKALDACEAFLRGEKEAYHAYLAAYGSEKRSDHWPTFRCLERGGQVRYLMPSDDITAFGEVQRILWRQSARQTLVYGAMWLTPEQILALAHGEDQPDAWTRAVSEPKLKSYVDAARSMVERAAGDAPEGRPIHVLRPSNEPEDTPPIPLF